MQLLQEHYDYIRMMINIHCKSNISLVGRQNGNTKHFVVDTSSAEHLLTHFMVQQH